MTINRLKNIDPLAGYIGAPALADSTGKPLQAIWEFLTQRHANSKLFGYSGPPSSLLNAGTWYETYWKYTSDFYIISKFANKPDDENIPLGAYVRTWKTQNTYAAAEIDTPEIYWQKDYTAGAPILIWDSAWGETNSDDYGDQANGYAIDLYDEEIFVADNSNGNFTCGILRVYQMMVADLCAFRAPSSVPTDAAMQVMAADVARAQVIRGYSVDDLESLGGLIHMMGSGIHNAVNAIETETRRCLFQWGHPVCVYLSGYMNDANIFNRFTWPIRCRNLKGDAGGAQVAYPAMVVKGGNGDCSIKYTSTYFASTAVYTFPAGGLANYTLVYPGCNPALGSWTGNLDVKKADMDYITISATQPDTGPPEVFVKTVALFEGAGY